MMPKRAVSPDIWVDRGWKVPVKKVDETAPYGTKFSPIPPSATTSSSSTAPALPLPSSSSAADLHVEIGRNEAIEEAPKVVGFAIGRNLEAGTSKAVGTPYTPNEKVVFPELQLQQLQQRMETGSGKNNKRKILRRPLFSKNKVGRKEGSLKDFIKSFSKLPFKRLADEEFAEEEIPVEEVLPVARKKIKTICPWKKGTLPPPRHIILQADEEAKIKLSGKKMSKLLKKSAYFPHNSINILYR